MNSDIRISTTFRNSRKRKRLARQLGDKAVVCLLDLWIATALSRPEGILAGWDEQDIADEAGWEGEPEVFVNALLEIGFLDRMPDSSFVIHNWEKHNPWAAGANRRSLKSKKAAALRWGFEVEDNAPAGQAVTAAPTAQQAPAAQDRLAPAPPKIPAKNGEQKTHPDNTESNPKAPVLPPAPPNPPSPAAQAIPPAQGDLAEAGAGIVRQDNQPDIVQEGIGPDFPGQPDIVQENSPGHPYNNGDQDADLCQAHPLSNAQINIEHGLGNAQTDIGHSLGNAQTDIGHSLGNAPSPSPSPNPYPYPSPSPSPSPSPGPSPGAGAAPAAAGSTRSRASPKKRQTDDKASSIKIPPCPHEEVIGLYHRCLPDNPRVESWTARNKKDLSLAWQADPARRNLDWWQDFFLRFVAQNRFLTGKKNSFAASLGWLIKPKVLGRILAGSYNDFTPNRDQGPALWFLEQTHARQGQDGLCQGNGSPRPDV